MNNNWLMKAGRDLLVARHLGGPETPKIRDAAAKAFCFVKDHGFTAPSPNMLKLVVNAGFELGLATTEEVQSTIDADIRSSWFNQKCGIKNEQFSWSHGVTEEFPEVCAYLRGFTDAGINTMRLANLCRLVDQFKRGRCYVTGMRTPPKVDRADFLDDLAAMLLGKEMKRTNQPSAQEVAWLIQTKAPELLEPNTHGLPPVMQPTTVYVYENAVSVETPTMPQGRFGGPVRVLSRRDGAFMRWWHPQQHSAASLFPKGLGEVISATALPQGVA